LSPLALSSYWRASTADGALLPYPCPVTPERTTLVPMNLTVTILASTVTAAVVTAVFGLLGQKLERDARVLAQREMEKARSRETIFTQSVELAKANRQFTMELAKEMGGGMTIHDYAVYAEMYYWLLMELHDKGKLPENWHANMKKKFPVSN